MKLLTVLTYYAPHWTGLTAHAVKVAEGLAARGVEVTVLTVRHSPELKRDEVVNGVRVVRLQPVSRFSRGMITPALLWAAPMLIQQHDIVQIHSPLPEGPILAAYCRLLRRPLLMTHHGDLVMPPGLLNQALQWIGYYVLLLTGLLANGVTSYSRDYFEHSKLLRHFRKKISFIYPPVEIPEPDPQAVLRVWRRELGLEGKRLIGFAGRWVEEKGFDYLLQAFPRILQTLPDAQLVFAGDREVVYDNFYRRCVPYLEPIQERFTSLGLIRDPQKIADFYALCDVFVQPSRTDMFALTQVEALLCGTPVVTSDIPGARVVIQETGFGRLAPRGQPVALADVITDVVQHRERYHPRREKVRKIFSTESSLDQYQRLMENLVAKRLSPPATVSVSSGMNTRAGARATPVEIIRYRGNGSQWRALSSQDHATLDGILRNEADMAHRRRARILLDYLELQDGDSVFDCGCGMGFYLMTMGKLRDLQLVGLDGDRERLHWAQRERVPASLLSGDIFELPVAAETFDKILFSEVLEHLSDDCRGLQEIHRVLKPGGILALSVPHARYPFWWDPINATWTRLGGQPIRTGPIAGIWSNHERLYEPQDLIQKIQAAGFALEAVEEQTHYSFPFIHFLVYGIGKPLIEKNLLPDSLRTSADRFRGEKNTGSRLNPINLGVGVFRYFDRRNEEPGVERQTTFVNILVKARKPG